MHHFLSALAYVGLNPVRARMVDCAVDSAWSSAAALAGTIPEWLEFEALHSRVTGCLAGEAQAAAATRRGGGGTSSVERRVRSVR